MEQGSFTQYINKILYNGIFQDGGKLVRGR